MSPWVFSTKSVPACRLCSIDHQFSVHHPHITSLQNLQQQSRANILLGSSTLTKIWESQQFQGVRDFYHDIIIGGQIHDSHFREDIKYKLEKSQEFSWLRLDSFAFFEVFLKLSSSHWGMEWSQQHCNCLWYQQYSHQWQCKWHHLSTRVRLRFHK